MGEGSGRSVTHSISCALCTLQACFVAMMIPNGFRLEFLSSCCCSEETPLGCLSYLPGAVALHVFCAIVEAKVEVRWDSDRMDLMLGNEKHGWWRDDEDKGRVIM